MPTVAVVNYPLGFFANRIGGDKIRILEAMSSDDERQKKWKPNSELISKLQQADLIFLNGANYCKWVQTVSLPQSKIVITSESFQKNYIDLADSFVHRHGPKGFRSPDELASYTWLDFSLAIKQAESIKASLIELLPQHSNEFEDSFAKLVQELSDLDKGYSSAGKQFQKTPILAAAPLYQYLAKRYELNIKSVDWRNAKVLNGDMTKDLNTILKAHSAKWMLWPFPPPKPIQTQLENEFQIRSIVFDPVGKKHDNGNGFVKSMAQNLEELESIKPAN